MFIEDKLFDKKKANFAKLVEYGFKKKKDTNTFKLIEYSLSIPYMNILLIF